VVPRACSALQAIRPSFPIDESGIRTSRKLRVSFILERRTGDHGCIYVAL